MLQGGSTQPVCGDGSVNQTSEQCDDGNTASGDGCSSTCKIEQSPQAFCGDGVKNQTSEQCDDGNTTSGDGCSSTCKFETDTTPPVITNVSSNKISNSGYKFRINWTTNEPATTVVRFTGMNALPTFTDNGLSTSHQVTFQGSRNKRYTYYVKSVDAAGNANERGPYTHRN
jgi:cysteine-rich repeat protein